MYQFPPGFLLEKYSSPSSTLEGVNSRVQLRSVRKTFKNTESYTVPRDILFIPLLGQKIFYTQGEAYPVSPGELLFIRKNAPLKCDLVALEQGRYEAIMFHLERDFIVEVLHKYQIELPATPQHPQNLSKMQVTPLLKSSIESLLPLYIHSSSHKSALTQIKMEELLLNMLDSPNEERHPFLNLLASNTDPEHQAYLELIERCVVEPMNVNEMSQALHKSPTVFKKEFKHYFKQSPAQYILTQRLDRAEALLLKSDLPITQIGFDCGFESTSHFIQTFKKKRGQTPGQLRKSN